MPFTTRSQTPSETPLSEGLSETLPETPLYSLAFSNVLVTCPEATPLDIGNARLAGTQITVRSVETGREWRVAARRINPVR